MVAEFPYNYGERGNQFWGEFSAVGAQNDLGDRASSFGPNPSANPVGMAFGFASWAGEGAIALNGHLAGAIASAFFVPAQCWGKGEGAQRQTEPKPGTLQRAATLLLKLQACLALVSFV